jgi:glutamate-5-semialdehyde dehydrogenase
MTGSTVERMERLTEGQLLLIGGDRAVRVDAALAAAFVPGDALLVAGDDVVHVPAVERRRAADAVDAALAAVGPLAQSTDEMIDAFFEGAARRLEDDATFAAVSEANRADVARARERGRSTTRLVLDDAMRAGMVAGLRMWRDRPGGRDDVTRSLTHDGWEIEVRRAPLGVVAFVFEGRPNVVTDAAGVVRTGNAAVLRIGSDALGTAEAIMTGVLAPALAEAGLPPGAVSLVPSPAHAAGHALFADGRVALAVARGSGPAVAQLGAIARTAGVPVSLHGTGGAWMIVSADADPARLGDVVAASLDRKVCNTLNVLAVERSGVDRLLPGALAGARRAAARRGAGLVVHPVGEADAAIRGLLTAGDGADGVHVRVEPIDDRDLGVEWEWDDDPEFSVCLVDDIDQAVDLCDRHGPHFVVSVVGGDGERGRELFEHVYRRVDAPFVGDGFTRWVDGQYALGEPELGLSNWEGGRLLGRAGVLSGDSVHTLRLVARFTDPTIHR